MLLKPPSRCWLPRTRPTYASQLFAVPTSRSRSTVSEFDPDGGASDTNAPIHSPVDPPNDARLGLDGQGYAIAGDRTFNPSKPTPVEVLWTALTGKARDSRTAEKGQSATPINSQWEQWDLRDILRPRRWRSKTASPGDISLATSKLGSVNNISDLHVIISQIDRTNNAQMAINAQKKIMQYSLLVHCVEHNEYEDILATMNSLLVWFKKQNVTVLKGFYMLGMRYACLCSSQPAFEYYLREFHNAGYGAFTIIGASRLVENLASVVKVRTWESFSRDKAPILRAVTGSRNLDGTPTDDSPTLHSLLPWETLSLDAEKELSGDTPNDFVLPYVRLLGDLQDAHTLVDVLSKIRPFVRGSPPESVILQFSTCLLALIKAGAPQMAIQAIHDIPSDCELRCLITPSVWRELLVHDYNGSLKNLIPESQLGAIFSVELRDIESRLGVKWSGGEDGRHVESANSATTPASVGDENFAVVHDEIPGLESSERLLAEIQARGSSKSTSDLSVIIDLLHDHEGREIPLGFIGKGKDREHVAWFPHCSPIEFSGSPTPLGNDLSTASSLGLIRAQIDLNGAPRKHGSTLYLIQTGYLSVRSECGTGGWKDTGHIVVWDRVNQRLLFLYVGIGRGNVPSKMLQPSDTPSQFDFAKATFDLDKLSFGYDSHFNYSLEGRQNKRRYWIEVDPGTGMVP